MAVDGADHGSANAAPALTFYADTRQTVERAKSPPRAL